MIFNINDRLKDLHYNNKKSNLKASNPQDAVDELSGKVDQIASNQIPDEYLKKSVDEYVNENSGGFATHTDISQLSSEINNMNRGSNVVDISMSDFVVGTIWEDGSYHSEITTRICTNRKIVLPYSIKVVCKDFFKTIVVLYDNESVISYTSISNEDKIIDAHTPFSIVISKDDFNDVANVGDFYKGLCFEMMCDTLNDIAVLTDNQNYFIKDFLGIPILFSDFVSGTFNVSTGKIRDYKARITTKSLVHIEKDIILSTHGNYTLLVYKYENGVYTLLNPTYASEISPVHVSANSDIIVMVTKFPVSESNTITVKEGYEALFPNQYKNILTNKKLNVIGDSYVAGHTLDISKTWSYLIAQKHNMIYRNYGINGNAITTSVEGITSGTPMMERYVDMDNDADYIIVVGGKNDYNTQIDLNTFEVRLSQFVEGLTSKYLGKKIGFFTPWRISLDENEYLFGVLADIPLNRYIEVIEKVCKKYSIPCFNSAEKSNILMYNQQFRNAYCLNSGDVSHLNENGNRLFVEKAENFISTL